MNSVLENSLTTFFSVNQPEARRIFHGRGQMYPGFEHLCVDWYAPSVLITIYEAIHDVHSLADTISSIDKLSQVNSIILQKRYEKGSPAECIHGSESSGTIVREDGLLFEVHPGRQQNAGLFLDMRPLRMWLAKHSKEKNMLNLFAYTCSLSVAALAGDATSVTNVDMSKTSIKWGEKNHQLNGQEMRRVRSIPHNVFRSWGRIKQYGRYDLVVIDPPTRQRGSFDVEKNYGAILRRLHQLCNPNADIIATLNSPFLDTEHLIHQFLRFAPTATFIGLVSPAAEFADKYPEKGLKICHFRIE